ncbi:hypothetical protein JJD41_10490 [Oxynema sp. CENA135]|uniref:tetratricopeptide repeat protein n=1 Tax=Oxynema sp. CENA135 TaxID=984206 RepID=UPI00190CFE62|nr:tetratricopeptide repeat protein [Oxynema sp. CENA135]MBK4730287.1 hypothetical protein [Oxynema sp. CENA135]
MERENGDRTNATHLEGVGTFKIAAGNYRKGIADLTRAIATCNGAVLLDENEAILYTLRAHAYWKLGDLDRARRDCDRADICDPNHVEVQHLRTELR